MISLRMTVRYADHFTGGWRLTGRSLGNDSKTCRRSAGPDPFGLGFCFVRNVSAILLHGKEVWVSA